MRKTLYKVICVNREERKENKKKIKVWINYIKVFLNSESEIKLKNKENLMNTVIEIYAVCINAAYNEKKAVKYSSRLSNGLGSIRLNQVRLNWWIGLNLDFCQPDLYGLSWPISEPDLPDLQVLTGWNS